LRCVPQGVDEVEVRARLLNDYNLEIGAGLGSLAGKVWRIGLMGYSANMKNVLYCLGALEAVLADLSVPIARGVAVVSAQRAIA
jgi:alanine-glyoxylate transaminase / serine-glyoxylate transaminase / serine-pyruvate transaminase